MSEAEKFIDYQPIDPTDKPLIELTREHYQFCNLRRSVRDYSNKPVDVEVMKNLIKTAGTAPSGAHKQPWTFALVGDPAMKRKIRDAAEKEEHESYTKRMSDQWLKDLKPLGTNWEKPFLEVAPWLIVVFKRAFEYEGDRKVPNYYVNESVGIACGMLIHAIHRAGLVTLTHTPSPMNFLSDLLNRPDNERPYLLLPVGYPDPSAKVPDIQRKSLEEISVIHA